ncbi:MAG TPA: lamin tail domain-containing protein [Acidimicrobiia bacterium]|nr:lamin tail domain-containing protein [Acidimicrobiia bacterium]
MGSRRDRRARSITRLALIAALVLVAACEPQPDESAALAHDWPARPASASEAQLVTVLDGDSLRVAVGSHNVEIRLAGINAPERDECHGDAARLALRDLASETVWIEVIDTDQFGRSVAGVWSEAGFVNGIVVARGGAIAMTDHAPWAAQLIAAESTARQHGVGMWSLDACGEPVTARVSLEMTSPDPPGPDDQVLNEEIVTIVNTGSRDLDLSGFVLRDESSVNRLRFPEGTVLPARTSLAVVTGCSPAAGFAWCAAGPIWNNAGDSAILLSPAGTVVAHVRYAPPG